MKQRYSHHPALNSLAVLLVGGVTLLASQAFAQPSNRPMLSSQAKAKPNIMMALDNSGSMAYPYSEDYGLLFTDDASHNLRFCPAPYRSYDLDNNYPVGGKESLTSGANVCRNNANNGWVAGVQQNYFPARVARNNWGAMRSAEVNPVYYNPRVTYQPRLGPTYAPLTRPTNPVFISNAGTTTRDAGTGFYQVYRNPTGGALWANHLQKPAPTPRPAWATPNDTGSGVTGNRVYALPSLPFPTHTEYTAGGGTGTTTFRYTYCRDAAEKSTIKRDTDRRIIGCDSYRAPPFATSAAGSMVAVYPPHTAQAATNVITLPADHSRTDCAAGNKCTNAEELNNILNWYHWYSTRVLATATAIGQSLSNPDFQKQLQVGYLPINDYTLDNSLITNNVTDISIRRNPAIAAPGTATGDPNVLRGVRLLEGGTTASTQIYGFLNNLTPRGGTPLHNAINKVAEYYTYPTANAVETPWAKDPSKLPSDSNELMSCRRSFNVLFSDGGWTYQLAQPADKHYDSRDGDVVGSDGFQFRAAGENTVAKRFRYTPYPSTGTNGLADLTAKWFWHTDMGPVAGLPNNAVVYASETGSNPTTWQNMMTFTVGYFIEPSGGSTGPGPELTFDTIETYKKEYIAHGYSGATKPAWPTGTLDVSTVTNQQRVDDFIHAGYTGGGRAYSARSAEEVRKIFDEIFRIAKNSSGDEAGVAVGSSGDSTSFAGANKFKVKYKTLDNSGEVEALILNATADVDKLAGTEWFGSHKIPAAVDRKIYTMHGTNTPIPLVGRFDALLAGTPDVANAIKQGPDASRVPNDESFINYLRGDDTALDAFGKFFRPRASQIAAIVNAAPLLMGGDRDYAYDLDEKGGGVEGRDSYFTFTTYKLGFEPYTSLFVETNAGMMHSFYAATGAEQSVMMPRRALKRALNFAKSPYAFEYVLDGPLSAHDVYNRNISVTNETTQAWKRWRHMAVGSGGRGEKLIYAVNAPFHAGNKSGGVDPNRGPEMADFLWETGPDLIDAADEGDVTMGYITNEPRSGQTEDDPSSKVSTRGRWIVAINNGHYNGVADGKKAGLIVLDANDGSVIRTIPLPDNYSAGRGLSGVTLLRSYATNSRVVAAYAGDANGQLWRFNLSGKPSEWKVEHGRPIFTVPGNRPIYGAPAWQAHPLADIGENSGKMGYLVGIATGMLLDESDVSDTGAQGFYAIWDRMDFEGKNVPNPAGTYTFPTVSDLLEQTVDTAQEYVLPISGTEPESARLYPLSDNKIDWDQHLGWRLAFGYRHLGERSISGVSNSGRNFKFSTVVPRVPASDDEQMCSGAQLKNYLYFLPSGCGCATDAEGWKQTVSGDDLRTFSIKFLPEGGFSSGFETRKIRYTKDGSLVPVSVSVPPGSSDDMPQLVKSADERSANRADEDSGESYIDSKTRERCTKDYGGEKVIMVGAADEAEEAKDDCEKGSVGWNRTQIQLSVPPAKKKVME